MNYGTVVLITSKLLSFDFGGECMGKTLKVLYKDVALGPISVL